MEGRQMRGMQIAEIGGITETPKGWVVQSLIITQIVKRRMSKINTTILAIMVIILLIIVWGYYLISGMHYEIFTNIKERCRLACFDEFQKCQKTCVPLPTLDEQLDCRSLCWSDKKTCERLCLIRKR